MGIIGGKWGHLVFSGDSPFMARGRKVKAVAADNEKVDYLGQHVRGLDAGRVILPLEWRPVGSPRDFMIILWPPTKNEYLLVLPPSRWEILRKNLAEHSLGDDLAALVGRAISSGTFKRSLDSYGRLPLPEEASKAVEIEKDAMLVGSMNKFEIWNPGSFQATLTKANPEEIQQAIKSFKI